MRADWRVNVEEAREHLNTIGSWYCTTCGRWNGFGVIQCEGDGEGDHRFHDYNPLGIVGTMVIRVMDDHGLEFSPDEDSFKDDMVVILNSIGIACGMNYLAPDAPRPNDWTSS